MERPVAKALAMTSATMLIIGSSLFQFESSRRADGDSQKPEPRAAWRPRRQRRQLFLLRSRGLAIVPPMADHEILMPADPADLAGALAYALRYKGSKRVHNADEIMSEIVAKRLVEHLERAGAAGGDGWRGAPAGV